MLRLRLGVSVVDCLPELIYLFGFVCQMPAEPVGEMLGGSEVDHIWVVHLTKDLALLGFLIGVSSLLSLTFHW